MLVLKIAGGIILAVFELDALNAIMTVIGKQGLNFGTITASLVFFGLMALPFLLGFWWSKRRRFSPRPCAKTSEGISRLRRAGYGMMALLCLFACCAGIWAIYMLNTAPNGSPRQLLALVVCLGLFIATLPGAIREHRAKTAAAHRRQADRSTEPTSHE